MLNFEKYNIVYDGYEKQSTVLVQLLKIFNINSTWTFTNSLKRYWIEKNIVIANNQGHPNREHITVSKLVELIFREYPELENLFWFRHLKEGDTVTIHFPSNNGIEFPFGANSEMMELEGKQCVIDKIVPGTIEYNSAYTKRKFFNGDYCRYCLKGSDWFWHSSMFDPIGTIPVKTVDLTSISILPEVVNIEPKWESNIKMTVTEADIQFIDPVDIPW